MQVKVIVTGDGVNFYLLISLRRPLFRWSLDFVRLRSSIPVRHDRIVARQRNNVDHRSTPDPMDSTAPLNLSNNKIHMHCENSKKKDWDFVSEGLVWDTYFIGVCWPIGMPKPIVWRNWNRLFLKLRKPPTGQRRVQGSAFISELS